MSAQWPKWLYRRNPKTGAKEGAVFDSPGDVPAGENWMPRDEWVAAMRASAVPPDATEEQPKDEDQQLSDDLDGMSREQLIEIADRAGVKIDRRWNPGKIATAIKAAAEV